MPYQYMKYVFCLAAVVLMVAVAAPGGAQEYELRSPDGEITIVISVQDRVSYSVFIGEKNLLVPSTIAMTLGDKGILGTPARVRSAKRDAVDRVLRPVVRQKSAEIREHYNELRLNFRGDFSLIFRAYNEGIAYRFETALPGEITVASEQVEFNFPDNFFVYFPEEEQFFSHNERQYKLLSLADISAEQRCSLPALIDAGDGVKMLISESDLENYPGLWLEGTGRESLRGLLPAYPSEVKRTGDRNVPVTEREDYLVKTEGTRTFPWRFIAISEEDGELLTNQLCYLLAKPHQFSDTAWIKPGKVAWDWFNHNNVYNVDFRAGINSDTYKYYIDFASRYGIEYIILDEGWYQLGDLMKVSPDIDVEEIVAYGEQKNVGVILWVVWKTLDDQLDEALDVFEQWGIKGLKVDFMQRDDAWMVNYYYKIAREAAARHMLVDFHGAHKPSGLRRAYPNVLTFEGVQGLEHCKWSANTSPDHDVTIPFIRMVAGPMDYTPGAMINAQKSDFQPIFNCPMSQGTRCHQLAMYVIYESPLQMLADSPTHYLRETECMEFLSKVPTVWDETAVLDAAVGEYVLMARKYGEDWYLGAMTNWQSRELHVDFSFLDAGDYTITIFQDGINADRNGNDYKKVVKVGDRDDALRITLAPGGGWVAMLTTAKP